MRRWLKKRLNYRVLVHTTEEQTIEGLLVADAADGLVLRAAVYQESGGSVPMSGEVFVPRARVAMIQTI